MVCCYLLPLLHHPKECHQEIGTKNPSPTKILTTGLRALVLTQRTNGNLRQYSTNQTHCQARKTTNQEKINLMSFNQPTMVYYTCFSHAKLQLHFEKYNSPYTFTPSLHLSPILSTLWVKSSPIGTK